MQPNSIRASYVILSAILLMGCQPPDEPEIETAQYGRIASPNGEMEAYVYETGSETDGLTQVIIEFYPGECGAGTASAYRSGLEYELRWIDDENLEVSHPPGIEIRHNASGEVLACLERTVRVHLRPREG